MKTFRKLVSITLCLMLVLGSAAMGGEGFGGALEAFTVRASAATNYEGTWTNGTKGSGNWALAGSTGKLYIDGTGELPDGFFNTSPYKDLVKAITFQPSSAITRIGSEAFMNAGNLTKVIFTTSLTSIGDKAFYSCNALYDFELPASLTDIGESAFTYCESITKLRIPSDVKEIKKKTFAFCTALKEVHVEMSKVQSIDEMAFARCSSLTDLYLPATLLSIGEWAFYGTEPTNLYFLGAPSVWNLMTSRVDTGIGEVTPVGGEYSVIDRFRFDIVDNSVRITDYKGESDIAAAPVSVMGLPVKTIGDGVHCAGSLLAGYVIPDSVTSISDYAFRGCDKLVTIRGGRCVKEIGEFVFNGCSPALKVYTCPDSALAAYALKAGIAVYESHDFSRMGTPVPSTCTEQGYTPYYCVCGAFEKRNVTPVTEHEIEHHEAQAPTCTAVGWEAYDNCKNCSYSTYAELEMLPHTYGSEWKSDADNHWHECTCGDKSDEAAHVDANHDGICDTCLRDGLPVVTKYTVTFDANGHGTAPVPQIVEAGGYAQKPTPAPTAEGWKFVNWYTEATCTNQWKFNSDAVNADITLYAKWTEDTPEVTEYTVTFDVQGHGTAPQPQIVAAGGLATRPATSPSEEGWLFGGWYKEAACENQWKFGGDSVNSDVTIYAKWTEDTPEVTKYTVTFDANGHGTAPAAQIVAAGGHAQKPTPAPAAEGWTFVNWYTEAACTNQWHFNNDAVNADITLYAKWTEDTPAVTEYTVTFDANGHGTDPAAQTVAAGGYAQKPTPNPTAEGWTFVNWYTEAACTNQWHFNNDAVNADITLYAKWTKNEDNPGGNDPEVTYTIPAFSDKPAAYKTDVTVSFTLPDLPAGAEVYIDDGKVDANNGRYEKHLGQLTSDKPVKVEVKKDGRTLDSKNAKVTVDSGLFAKIASFFTNFLFNGFKWKTDKVNF